MWPLATTERSYLVDNANKAMGIAQVFRAQQLRHPAAGLAEGFASTGFIANDVALGGDEAPFILLTGPNMGGKSTLLRQVGCSCRLKCLAKMHCQASLVSIWRLAAAMSPTSC